MISDYLIGGLALGCSTVSIFWVEYRRFSGWKEMFVNQVERAGKNGTQGTGNGSNPPIIRGKKKHEYREERDDGGKRQEELHEEVA